jgi:type I restriction-modification system DNA methylase subunit
MSEELLQRGLLHNPQKIGEWNFYNIGSTTIKSLKEHGIIRNINYGDIENKKVDGIITDGYRIVAIIENKKPSEFKTWEQKDKAIKQELKVAKKLTKLLIVTDTKETIWINALNGETIKDEKCNELKQIFNPKDSDIIDLINKINESISQENSILKPIELINPTELAKQIWQDIWMVSGATPENCLYTFVELFIFKYLSDLGVLKGTYSFDDLINMYEKNTDEDILEQYAKVIRPKIKELFKENPIDHTTIINGTIFVSKDQKAVKGYSTVFKKVLYRFRDYKKLDNIDKDFKSKLFESFMKESISKKNWGQFFTPLKVVRAITKMTDIKNGDKICDPACGVGKFLLEPIANNFDRFYEIKEGKIKQKIKIIGYDKGFDNEEQKTIILAKANMLIYLSDLIKKHPNLTEQFSELFNESFILKTNSILGTLADSVNEEYDWILTNPPYVITGSSNLKEEITKSGLESHYKINAMGVEGLFLEWIIRALRPNGKAFVIIPDGILNRINDKNLRRFTQDECYLDGIISLPTKTFFTSIKKTYILILTKKDKISDVQKHPVFTYLVSNIGETLDIHRFEIPENDLSEMVDLFNQFKGAKTSFKPNSPRCKIIPIDQFKPESNWVIDRLWSKEEKIILGIAEEEKKVNVSDFSSMLDDVSNNVKEFIQEVKSVEEGKETKCKEVSIPQIFDITLGSAKYNHKYFSTHKGKYPVYSGQTKNMGEISQINTFDYDLEGLTWTIDGYAGKVFYRNGKFNLTCHCGLLTLKNEVKDKLNYEFLKYLLDNELPNYSVGEGNKRLKKTHIEKINIKIPIDKKGKYDLKKQQEIAKKYKVIEQIKNELKKELEKVYDISVEFV